MCETHVRASDERRPRKKTGAGKLWRIAKRPAAARASSSSSSSSAASSNSSDDAPLNFAKKGRNSAKASFLAKCLGPVDDYAADFELVQFVYDLWLWGSLGAKKNSVDAPMRVTLSGYSFSPLYWETRHAALIDMVRQLGLPTLFITLAPYEWSFPYHRWILHEMELHLRPRLTLAGLETLHIVHVLVELLREFVAGGDMKHGEALVQHCADNTFADAAVNI